MNIRQQHAKFECTACRHAQPVDLAWRCDRCGSPLLLKGTDRLTPDDIDRDEYSLWRYHAWFGVGKRPSTSLGEGWTPLVRQPLGGIPVQWKCEFINPSGSFKDRGISVMVDFLKESGITSVAEDSSGNGGASLATYSAAASLHCRIFVPEKTSPGKLAQIAAAGAQVVKISGTRQEVTEAAMNATGDAYYASHNWHPMFAEGMTSLGYEIWEQSGFSAPDLIIAPLGGGSTILGCYRAFRSLVNSGLAERIPRLIGVQAGACEPFARAFAQESERCGPVEVTESLAEGIVLSRPVRDREVLRALRDSGGAVLSVSEEEIRQGFYRLAGLGFYVEPTSAVTGAALEKMMREGEIAADQSVVTILTGSGLKFGRLP